MRAAFASVILGLVVAAQAQPAPDLARAKDLYLAAETAMTDGRFTDAIRDYGATFDITRDPILFYKIAAAHQKAGTCDVALIYYGRYVKEARPTDRYLELTKERVKECGGDARAMPQTGTPEPKPDPKPEPKPEPKPDPKPEPSSGPAPAPGPGTTGTGDGAGSAAGGAPPLGLGRHRAAWLLVTTSIAFVTVGSILAYSANSAESDISDLYQGFTGTPSEFDDNTRELYDELVAEGRRYERLSWLSFGLAGATAVAAIVLFKTGVNEKAVVVAPTASPEGAGVRATLRW